jgi:hypothetical protein
VTRSKTVGLVLGAAFVLALAWATPVVYAHGGDTTLIHACVMNNNGNVRIVGANTSCRNNETAVDWPGTSATPGQGSIMVHSGGIPSDAVPQPACLLPGSGGTSVNCAYRSPRDGTIQNMRLLIHHNAFTGPAVVTIVVNGSPTLLSGLPGAKSGKFTVRAVAEIITLWPGRWKAYNSWKIKTRI